MFKKFVKWFIIFGLSFLVSDVFDWAEQGKAFFYIDIGIVAVMILIGIIIVMITDNADAGVVAGASFLTLLITAGVVAIILLATWGATKLFDVEFFVAYQIMTFGKCLCGDTNKKKDD